DARGAVELQPPGQPRLAVATDHDLGARELRSRKPRRIQEFGRAEVGVALGRPGLDAGDVDPDLDLRTRDLIRVEDHRTAPVAEQPLDLADHDMAQRETEPRIVGVDLPSFFGWHGRI